jgi:hypothetical protein
MSQCNLPGAGFHGAKPRRFCAINEAMAGGNTLSLLDLPAGL